MSCAGLVDCLPVYQPLQGRRGACAEMRDERPMSVTSGTKRKEGGVGETVRVIIHALIIALVIRTFLFQPFNIPSGSMKATLLVGDYLFVSKYTYGYSHFSLPLSPPLFSRTASRRAGCLSAATSSCSGCRRTTSTDYIKRVIGLPGDRIQMIDGVLNINGAAGQARARAGFHRDRGGHAGSAGQALEGNAAERRELLHARSGR